MNAQPTTITDIVIMLIGCLIAAYLIVGAIVVVYIWIFRRPVFSPLPRNGIFWEPRYHKRNTNWLLLDGVLGIFIWPALLLVDEEAKEDEIEGEPKYHGPTTLDDDDIGGQV